MYYRFWKDGRQRGRTLTAEFAEIYFLFFLCGLGELRGEKYLRRGWFGAVMVEVDGYLFGDALRLHSHAVKHISNAHRSLGVRDYDELGFLLEFPDDSVKAFIVRLIEGRVNFV